MPMLSPRWHEGPFIQDYILHITVNGTKMETFSPECASSNAFLRLEDEARENHRETEELLPKKMLHKYISPTCGSDPISHVL